MKSVNEQFAEMQKKTLESLEPVKNMNAVAAEAFERIARKNYDLMGDLVDYAVAQVKTPATAKNLQEAYEQRVAETKAFAEKVNARAAEYVALAGELGELAKSKAPAAPKAKASSAKASSVAETAKTAPALLLPKRHLLLPKRHLLLPKRQLLLPKRHLLLPRRHLLLPRRHLLLPRRHLLLPKRHLLLPRQHLLLQRKRRQPRKRLPSPSNT